MGPTLSRTEGRKNVTDKKPRLRLGLSTGSIAWLAITLIFAAVAVASLVFPPERPSSGPALVAGFDLQGHRGARGLAPENTLPGFEAALAVGVTTLEMDAGMTRDGVLVVHHNRRLNPDRTRGPGGAWLDAEAPAPALVDLDAQALAAYDVGRPRPEGKSAERFPEQRGLDGVAIPTLEAVLARAEALSGSDLRYNIETKISPEDPETSPDPESFALALVALLQGAGLTERAAVQSFDWRSLQAVQAQAPEIATVYLTAEQDWLDNVQRGRDGVSPWTAGLDVDRYGASVPRLIAEAGGAVWSPYYRDLREAELREARRLGLRVVVWTVNDPDDMASLIELGVDGIITDYPDRLRAVMEVRGMTLPPRFPADGAGE